MPETPSADGASPYDGLPATAFWRTGVAEAGAFGLSGLWRAKWALPADARFSTYGSCFAQHISRAMIAQGVAWVNAEPAPGRTPAKLAAAYGYGVYSSRTGNVYTAAQLLLARLAVDQSDADAVEVWADGTRFRDSLRPTIEPGGFASHEEALLSRRSMVRAFRRSVTDAEVFIFTLGLTEGWENAQTGQCYPLCPGTVAGRFDPATHIFANHAYPRIRADLERAFALLRGLNPTLRILLTVSPVPLTATASGGHVLTATIYSKSTLRAVAGDLAADDPGVDYFPSYEIVTGPAARSAFFAPNLRSVVREGVDVVMGHFFRGLDLSAPAERGAAKPGPEAGLEAAMAAEDLVCEEMVLERFNAG